MQLLNPLAVHIVAFAPWHPFDAPRVDEVNLKPTRFQQLNIDIRETTPAEFGKFVQDQMALWSKVVKEANIRLG